MSAGNEREQAGKQILPVDKSELASEPAQSARRAHSQTARGSHSAEATELHEGEVSESLRMSESLPNLALLLPINVGKAAQGTQCAARGQTDECQSMMQTHGVYQMVDPERGV